MVHSTGISHATHALILRSSDKTNVNIGLFALRSEPTCLRTLNAISMLLFMVVMFYRNTLTA
jgi:hypothetical protein